MGGILGRGEDAEDGKRGEEGNSGKEWKRISSVDFKNENIPTVQNWFPTVGDLWHFPTLPNRA